MAGTYVYTSSVFTKMYAYTLANVRQVAVSPVTLIVTTQVGNLLTVATFSSAAMADSAAPTDAYGIVGNATVNPKVMLYGWDVVNHCHYAFSGYAHGVAAGANGYIRGTLSVFNMLTDGAVPVVYTKYITLKKTA